MSPLSSHPSSFLSPSLPSSILSPFLPSFHPLLPSYSSFSPPPFHILPPSPSLSSPPASRIGTPKGKCVHKVCSLHDVNDWLCHRIWRVALRCRVRRTTKLTHTLNFVYMLVSFLDLNVLYWVSRNETVCVCAIYESVAFDWQTILFGPTVMILKGRELRQVKKVLVS